jgi:hypothetical protein
MTTVAVVVVALYTHVRVADYTVQFGLAVIFFAMASASLMFSLTA